MKRKCIESNILPIENVYVLPRSMAYVLPRWKAYMYYPVIWNKKYSKKNFERLHLEGEAYFTISGKTFFIALFGSRKTSKKQQVIVFQLQLLQKTLHA